VFNKYYFLIAVLFFACNSFAQNLVPNSGFDNYNSCPNSSSQFTHTPPWMNPNGASPDYMNACFAGGAQGVPSNFYGYQQPRSGFGYYGMILYYINSEVREYMSAPLISPLIAGVVYKVGFYVSRADNFEYAVDHIGAYLSTGPVSGFGNVAMNNYIPQIDNGAGNFVTDTAGWTFISGLYTAAGGENRITIGNFYNDAATQTIDADPSSTLGWAYYLFEDVTVEIANPLPVELVSFTGKNEDNKNILQWKTTSEINNDYFTVEKSDDGKKFQTITKIKGAGNSNTILDYSYIDGNISMGVNYYRLKQTDFNGRASFSKIIKLNSNSGNESSISIYPIPASQNFIIQFPSEENFNIVVTDCRGEKVMEKKDVLSQTLIDAQNLSEGIYFLHIISDERSVFSHKIIIKK
jgi:type IX secretion system substrate protein